MIVKSSFVYLGIVFLGVFLLSCSEDTGVNSDNGAVDYFPFNSNYRWIYETNAFSDIGESVVQFEMKIDTYEYETGEYYALQIKLESQNWEPVFALLDSGNIVYSLGDFPPECTIPLFKHTYNDDEIEKIIITVGEREYYAVKLSIEEDEEEVLSFWFADGVGLVKEHSTKGASIFTDDLWGNDVEIVTELVELHKD